MAQKETPKNSLTFLGAAETVTGSRYLVQTPSTKLLIDCGLFQGFKSLRLRNWEPFPVEPAAIDKVLLTHAHLDHSGYVPALVRSGFSGEILMTEGTFELCKIMWADSAYLLQEDAERANLKGYSKHQPALPLYDITDVEKALKLVRVVEFDKQIPLSADISATFKHAGHILGAAQLLLEVNKKKIFFSGDLGRAKDALMKPPAAFEGSDILITESTYGNRTHPETNPEKELAEVLGRVIKRGGTAIIPAFAVGRTQALLLHIYRIMKSGQIPTVPVYLNSPMANKVTDLYEKHREEHKLEIDEFNAMYDIVKMVKTVDESKELNTDDTSKIIIAASGMLTGGRVLHHVKRFGRDSMNAILIVGYQAGGTRGRALIDGAKSLRIFGGDVPIRAEVVRIDSLSAHMDSAEVLAWMKSAKNPPAMTYLTHGEPEASDQLRIQVDHQLNWPVRVATMGEVIDLDNPK